MGLIFKKFILPSVLTIIATTLTLTAVFNHFYHKYVFEPTFENTVNSVSSYIDQWQRTVKTFDLSYKPVLKTLIDELAQQYGSKSIVSDRQLTQTLNDEVSRYLLQYVSGVNWYLISPGGVIERTDYTKDLGLDIAKAVPRYWTGRLEPLNPGEYLMESLSFEYRTNLPRIFGYKKLQDGWIIEIGLALDPVIVTDLWEGLQRIMKANKYIREIRLYSLSFIPFGEYEPVIAQEKDFFNKQEAENNFVVQNVGSSLFKLYKNWIPIAGQSIDWSGKSAFFTIRALTTLDFSKMEQMKNSVILVLNSTMAVAVLFVFLASLGVFKNISNSIVGLLNDINRFQRSPLDVNDESRSVDSYIREISDLRQSFQQMKEQMRDRIIAQNLTNERLKEDLEKYKFDIFLDPLTGLFNRRFLIKCLEDIQKRGGNLSICFLDIDSFKRVNDSYGHDVGDIVLKTLSVKLQGEIRKKDLSFRIGGDEFVILFFDLKIQEAEQVVQRIQSFLEQVKFKDFPSLNISLSYGFSQWTTDSTVSIEDALREADLQMYKAKFEKKRGFDSFHKGFGDISSRDNFYSQ